MLRYDYNHKSTEAHRGYWLRNETTVRDIIYDAIWTGSSASIPTVD
jgi:hypothetical protein